MDKFIEELEILLTWAEGLNDLDLFEKEFNDLVDEYKENQEVLDLAKVVAHNYNCHTYNRKDALIHNWSDRNNV